MDREDSGLIDLFALHEQGKAARARELVPPDVFSSPPPAFTTDLYGDPGQATGDMGRRPAIKPIKLLIYGGAVAVLLAVGVAFVTVRGNSDEASASAAAKSESASAPPPQAPAPVEPPPMPSPAASIVPPPPTTGTPAAQAPAPRVGRATTGKARRPAAVGPKLTKVQSGGVASH